MNERAQALNVLIRLLRDKKSLAQQLPALTECSPMTKELCFGVCRHYFRLVLIADSLIKKRPKELEIWLIVLLGLYQLYYLNSADYAVVKETVNLLNTIKKTWAKGLVNAVLRNFCRRKEELIAQFTSDPAFQYGQPEWLLQQLQIDWPLHWQQITQANDEHPPMTLRVNQQKNQHRRLFGFTAGSRDSSKSATIYGSRYCVTTAL